MQKRKLSITFGLTILAALVVTAGFMRLHHTAYAQASRTDCVATVRGYLGGLQPGRDWKSYLSDRWRDCIPADVAAWPTVDVARLSGMRVVSQTNETAVVEYALLVGKDGAYSRTFRDYLVWEHGQWAIDDPIHSTPEWAVPQDLRPLWESLRDKFTALEDALQSGSVKEIRGMLCSDDQAELDDADIEAIAAREQRFRKSLGPCLSVTLGTPTTEGDITYMSACGYLIAKSLSRSNRNIPYGTVHLSGGPRVFVREGADWRPVISCTVASDDEVLKRFLSRWKGGRVTQMARLATSGGLTVAPGGVDAEAATVKTSEIGTKLPRLADYGAPRRTNGYRCELHFSGSLGKWPSGQYEFRMQSIERFGYSYSRVKSIRFLGS